MGADRSVSFWILFALFQIAFGTAVFLGTKLYYQEDATEISPSRAAESPATTSWPDGMSAVTPEVLNSLVPRQSNVNTSAGLAEQANAHFVNGEYEAAAVMYEQLVNANARNIVAYNNLGITLHYLGRSTEALEWLNAGTELEPQHQRSWLTIGFIQKELGNTAAATTALDSALELDPNSTVGKSAAKFLQEIRTGN